MAKMLLRCSAEGTALPSVLHIDKTGVEEYSIPLWERVGRV